MLVIALNANKLLLAGAEDSVLTVGGAVLPIIIFIVRCLNSLWTVILRTLDSLLALSQFINQVIILSGCRSLLILRIQIAPLSLCKRRCSIEHRVSSTHGAA